MATLLKILPGTGRWREATEGSRLSTDAAFAGAVGPLRPLEGAPPRAGENLR